MSDSAMGSGRDHAQLVVVRGRELSAVRARLGAARNGGARQWDPLPLREELLAALEALAAAVSEAGGTLPYRLKAEIDLCRRLRHLR